MYQVIIKSSIRGKGKLQNEDNLLVIDDSEYNLFFVFDGVSSALNGKIASDYSKEFIKNNHRYYFGGTTYFLQELLFDLNLHLLKDIYIEPYVTFACVLKFKRNENLFYYASLGDSRIYKFDSISIGQLTVDDAYPNSSVITQCLGLKKLPKEAIEVTKIILRGRGILLCTDGFSEILEENKKYILEIFNMKYFGLIKKKLTKIIRRFNIDDTTFILVINNV